MKLCERMAKVPGSGSSAAESGGNNAHLRIREVKT